MSDRMKSLAIGFCGALAAVLIVAAIYFVYDVHRMAKNGDAAFRFIDTVQRQQAAQQAAPATK